MLGGRDLEGRALDQRPQVFAGEYTDLDSPTLGFRVELRPVGEACGRRVEGPKQAAWRTMVDFDPRLGSRQPSRRPGFAGPAHSDIRMTLTIYTRTTEGTQDSARAALEETLSRSGC
jgi:hypothetical protein